MHPQARKHRRAVREPCCKFPLTQEIPRQKQGNRQNDEPDQKFVLGAAVKKTTSPAIVVKKGEIDNELNADGGERGAGIAKKVFGPRVRADQTERRNEDGENL